MRKKYFISFVGYEKGSPTPVFGNMICEAPHITKIEGVAKIGFYISKQLAFERPATVLFFKEIEEDNS